MVRTRFSEADHDKVTDAVRAAEAKSAGEIVTIVAGQSDPYHDVGLHYAVLAMLLVPIGLGLAPQGLIDWATGLLLGWNAEPTRTQFALWLFVKLAAAFLIVRYALAYMPLRMALTPRRTKARRVHRRAVEVFRTGCELQDARPHRRSHLPFARRAARRDRRRPGDRREGAGGRLGRRARRLDRRSEGGPARRRPRQSGGDGRRRARPDPPADPARPE